MLPPVPSYAAMACPLPLRRHQQQALDAVLQAERDGSTRWWVTMPPGAGKTLLGTEVARLGERRTVVFSPNTAIAGQWVRTWESYGGPPAGERRDLTMGFTSLTYQSLAVFDEAEREAGDGDPDGPSGEGGSQIARLHANGRELVATMQEAGPLLVVLDECHHLLETWGELLREVLALLPEATVLGLTATPPGSVTEAQAGLVEDLFGPVLYEARIPALVKDGVLAPYAELAWVVSPTVEESQWLAAQSERFAELISDLFDPEFATTSLPAWLRQRFHDPLGTDTTWQELAAREPELSDAVLRLAEAELVELPFGATLQERHREAPTATDWRWVIDDWLRQCVLPASEGDGPGNGPEEGPADGTDAERDARALRAVAAALPSIGYVWTRRGVRVGQGVVDRVTARSRAKETAVSSIVGAELANLGERARVLVLCDHEGATATSSARVRDADDDQPPPQPAGSATGVLATLLADPVAAGLDPMLVTGRTVAGSVEGLERFLAWLGETHPMLSGNLRVVTDGPVPRLEGRWSSAAWVAHVTAYFALGGTQCLVGTRGLLGEGWDAPCVTTLVDLTTVTTPTAVVQTRGRALRLDPEHPDKVAQVWSVVCVADHHVAGGNDWHRFTQARRLLRHRRARRRGRRGGRRRLGLQRPPPAAGRAARRHRLAHAPAGRGPRRDPARLAGGAGLPRPGRTRGARAHRRAGSVGARLRGRRTPHLAAGVGRAAPQPSRRAPGRAAPAGGGRRRRADGTARCAHVGARRARRAAARRGRRGCARAVGSRGAAGRGRPSGHRRRGGRRGR